jgi:predicted Zn-dependent protease
MSQKVAKLSVVLLLTGLLSSPAGFGQDQKNSNKKNSDVDNIGDRDINKHSINFTSLEKEQQLGRQLADEVERQVKLFKDPVVNEYVNRVGQNLVRNSDAKVPFIIKVVDSDEINAFALPGGFFYVNTGLILAADEEAELAGVMGHEIAHVAARHATENMAKGTLANIATIPLIMLGGPAGMGARQAASFMVPLQFLQFSRKDEAEADYLGLQYMYKAGYDPSAFISMFEKLQAKETAKAGSMSKLFSTHPPTGDRIEATKKNIEQILPDREQYIVTTSEFKKMRDRISMMQSEPVTAIDNSRPNLRRSAPNSPGPDSGSKNPSPNTGTSGSSDDDRPTLKRNPNKPNI